jgi:hypothetical protein
LQVIKTRVRSEVILSDEQIEQRIFRYYLAESRQRFLVLMATGLGLGIIGYFFWAQAMALGCVTIVAGLIETISNRGLRPVVRHPHLFLARSG